MPSAADSTDVLALLRTLRGTDPGRPRLTWYGPGSERIELSAHVLENWVAKTANLLTEELDVVPGDAVLVDLPPHWRTGVWLLAVWAVGGHVVVPAVPHQPNQPNQPDPQSAVVGVVDDGLRPEATADSRAAGRSAWHVAVALAPLALRHPSLPAGALDYAAQVGGQGDVFVPVEPHVDPSLPALTVGDVTWSHGRLIPAGVESAAAHQWPAAPRVLDAVGADPSSPRERDVVSRWIAPWANDGSLVLVHPDAAVRHDTLAAAEQADAERR